MRGWIPAFAGMTDGKGMTANFRHPREGGDPSPDHHPPTVILAKAGIHPLTTIP